jgi:hypothetical protein
VCASPKADSGCGAPVDFAREHAVNVAKAVAANVQCQWRIGMVTKRFLVNIPTWDVA